MRYFCAEREKCQNLCTKQCSYKAEWGWERSWVNRRINLAERNRNLSHVKTCLFMNTIKAIILLSSLMVPKMAARGATWLRTSIRCEAVWCHRTILSLNANDFQGWLQAIINHFVLRATSSFTSGARTSGTYLANVLLSAISHVVFQNKPNWERWSKIIFFFPGIQLIENLSLLLNSVFPTHTDNSVTVTNRRMSSVELPELLKNIDNFRVLLYYSVWLLERRVRSYDSSSFFTHLCWKRLLQIRCVLRLWD